MSIKMMTMVWGCGSYEGGHMMVLLAMADHADDKGGSIFPTVRNLARKARISPRQVHRCIKDLKEDGIIGRDPDFGQTPNGAIAYRLDVKKLRRLNEQEDARLEAEEGSARRSGGGSNLADPPLPNDGEGLPLLADNNRQSKPSIKPSLPADAGKAAPSASKKKDAPRTAIGDFRPDDGMVGAAQRYWQSRGRHDLCPLVLDEVERFLANHRARGTRMASWPDAWKTWYSNAPQMNRQPFQARNAAIPQTSPEDRDLAMWLWRLEVLNFGAEEDGTGEEALPVGYWDASWGPKGEAPAAALAAFAKKHPARAVK